MTAPNQHLIVALDVADRDAAAALVETLSPHAGWFKIGAVLFTREGPAICRMVKDAGARLFLDLKYHDIPNTVAGSVSAAADLGADMLTVHASGGPAMLRAAGDARRARGADELLIVGVTVLTHLTLEDFASLFASKLSPESAVLELARVVRDAGLDGVVASGREVSSIKSAVEGLLVVTPGIRLPDAAADDQTRVVTPARAIRDGADYIVVGRPIIAAADPVAACRRVIESMSEA